MKYISIYNTRPIIKIIFIGVLFVVISTNGYRMWKITRPAVVTCTTHYDTYKIVSRRVAGAMRKLLVADTAKKQAYGLMFITSRADICNHDGMIFPLRTKQIAYFWNKNTITPLRLIWVRNGEIVGEDIMHPIIPGASPDTWDSEVSVDTVIELLETTMEKQ